MFDRILIANRGEIAVRIIKTARRLGISTGIVFSDADASSLAVEMADASYHIGPSPSAQSYLVMDKIVAAARALGAQAVHPGFGFLSENANFARRLRDEKIIFIGPNAEAIDAMGDKIESKKRAAAAKISTVPGFLGEISDAGHAIAIAAEIGYPVMIKASAGGGGKGIRVAYSAKEVTEGFAAVRAEAKNAFGDDRIFIEKFVLNPRHVEIQVLGDKHGNIVHLFERECSIQRRNQKVIEEAPSPLLDAKTRAAMGAQAVALARAVNYDSAGTVEFVASGVDKSFFFLEMNTRLQVEHPVTEMITGLDLVEQMIRVAAGEKLAFGQKDLKINGWAMETRLYAEDPRRNFLPSIGRLRRFEGPDEGPMGPGTYRLDSGVREGDEISIYYDPMIAKLVTHGTDRAKAIATQSLVLDRLLTDGLTDNGDFLACVMAEPRFQSGDFTTSYIKETFPEGFSDAPLTSAQTQCALAAAAYAHSVLAKRAAGARGEIGYDWEALSAETPEPIHLVLGAGLGEAQIQLGDSAPKTLRTLWRPGQRRFLGRYGDTDFALKIRPSLQGWRVVIGGARLQILIVSPFESQLRQRLPEKPKLDLSRRILSPMPGLVIGVEVKVGQEVKSGEAVAIIEAMKMQNTIRVERDGIVKSVHAVAGDSVAADEILIELT